MPRQVTPRNMVSYGNLSVKSARQSGGMLRTRNTQLTFGMPVLCACDIEKPPPSSDP